MLDEPHDLLLVETVAVLSNRNILDIWDEILGIIYFHILGKVMNSVF